MLLSPVVLVFCIFHHAHILDRNIGQSLLSKIALVFGCVASCGAFVAGNCNVSATGGGDGHTLLINTNNEDTHNAQPL